MPSFKLKAITPAKMPTGEVYAQAVKKAVYKAAGLVLKDLQATVRTWKHKPKFDITITETGNNYSVTAGTNDEIYGYVDKGTKAHKILPKRSRYLRFSSGYRAKTRVGVIGSFEGGSFGSDVFSRGVMHPGFPGRKFTQKIRQRRQVTVKQEVDQSIAKVNRKQKN